MLININLIASNDKIMDFMEGADLYHSCETLTQFAVDHVERCTREVDYNLTEENVKRLFMSLCAQVKKFDLTAVMIWIDESDIIFQQPGTLKLNTGTRFVMIHDRLSKEGLSKLLYGLKLAIEETKREQQKEGFLI